MGRAYNWNRLKRNTGNGKTYSLDSYAHQRKTFFVSLSGLPNIFGKGAYTPTPIVGGSLLALSELPGVKRIDLVENSAIGFPTRLNYKFAGYFEEIESVRNQTSCPASIFCMDEERRDSVFTGKLCQSEYR